MKLKMVDSVIISGNVVPTGAVVDVPERFAVQLLNSKKAVAVKEALETATDDEGEVAVVKK